MTLAIEVWSPSEHARDKQQRRDFYDRYGVDEFWEYDPQRLSLRVWQRQAARLVETLDIESWYSPVCGCRPTIQNRELVVFDRSGTPWPTSRERTLWHVQYRARQHEANEAKREAEREAERRADAARATLDALKARIVELEAELARLPDPT